MKKKKEYEIQQSHLTSHSSYAMRSGRKFLKRDYQAVRRSFVTCTHISGLLPPPHNLSLRVCKILNQQMPTAPPALSTPQSPQESEAPPAHPTLETPPAT